MTRFTLSDAMLLVGMLCVCFSVVTFPSERTDLALTILVGLSVTNLLHCGLIELRTLGRSTRLFLGIAIAIFIVLRPIPGSRNLGIEMYYLLHDSKETRSTLSIDSLRDTFLSSVDLLCACLIAVALASGNIVIRAVHYKISGNKDSSQLQNFSSNLMRRIVAEIGESDGRAIAPYQELRETQALRFEHWLMDHFSQHDSTFGEDDVGKGCFYVLRAELLSYFWPDC